MTLASKSLGAHGEAAARVYLEVHGYRIVDSNVRPFPGMARGEIDIIAWDQETLVFVEVKTRRRAYGRQGTPAESVTARKRSQIIQLANFYLAKHNLADIACRFDVIEVVLSEGYSPTVSHLQNAFDASD